jgi:aerobic-type carbon monoxide dehydrogenase small subunit (CoxS/CutS family)
MIDDKNAQDIEAWDEGNEDRRFFLKQSVVVAGFSLAPGTMLDTLSEPNSAVSDDEIVKMSLTVNGVRRKLLIDPRITLLDLLREQLALTGTKKGCDFGQCGACTVHADGKRILSCLSLAVMQDGKKIKTIEGLANGADLHPMQAAIIKHDGLQCGYCTPGQIMSAICCISEGHADTEAEIQEYMSGNLCRCGAYPNIVQAIIEVNSAGKI